MFDCKCNCSYIAVIVAIVLGFVLGTVAFFGFIPTTPAIIVMIAIGLAGLFFAPIYQLLGSISNTYDCFCSYAQPLLVASIGTIVASVLSFILFGADVAAVVPFIFFAIAVFFAVLLIGIVVCLTRSVRCCDNRS